MYRFEKRVSRAALAALVTRAAEVLVKEVILDNWMNSRWCVGSVGMKKVGLDSRDEVLMEQVKKRQGEVSHEDISRFSGC